MAVKMLNGVVLATLLLASGAEAQSLAQIGGPANAPPAGFRGQQFVDSRGCLFLRAGYGSGVNWVARVDRNHKPICNMVPTGSAAAQAAVAADMAPDPQAVTQSHVAQSTTVAPVQPAAKPQVNALAFLAPRQEGAAPSPAAQPTVVASTPGPQVATAMPAQRTVPVNQATGVATSVAGVQCYGAAPVLERVNVTGGTALVCTRGDGSSTGWLPPMVSNATQARVAAQIAPLITAPVMVTAPAQGLGFQVASVQVYAAPQPVPVRSHALPKPPKGWVYAWKDDRLNPLRGVGTAQGQAQQDMVWQRTIPMVLVGDPLPQTAFQRALGIHPKATALRLSSTVLATGLSTTVSTMSAQTPAQTQNAAPVLRVAPTSAAPKAMGSMLIQVGCFGDPANAQGVVARLSAMGLPVSTSTINRNGKALQIVYAGPFGSGTEASSGLATVHSAGYADAFLR